MISSLLLLLAPVAFAQQSPAPAPSYTPTTTFSAGLVVGEPTGLTVAWRPGTRGTIQSHLSWSIARDRMRLSVDYLFDVAQIPTSGGVAMTFPVYVGVGGIVGNEWKWRDDMWVGARIPVGVAGIFDRAPLELFAELAPVIYLVPETDAELEGALGIRFRF